jgi:hypothetical protein
VVGAQEALRPPPLLVHRVGRVAEGRLRAVQRHERAGEEVVEVVWGPGLWGRVSVPATAVEAAERGRMQPCLLYTQPSRARAARSASGRCPPSRLLIADLSCSEAGDQAIPPRCTAAAQRLLLGTSAAAAAAPFPATQSDALPLSRRNLLAGALLLLRRSADTHHARQDALGVVREESWLAHAGQVWRPGWPRRDKCGERAGEERWREREGRAGEKQRRLRPDAPRPT